MDDDTPIYLSQSINNDYLTLKGIELRTKIKKDEIYTIAITGEALDNSIDYMETYGVKDPPCTRHNLKRRNKGKFFFASYSSAKYNRTKFC